MNRAGIGTPEGKLEYVQVRHEEMSAFMACAHMALSWQLPRRLIEAARGSGSSFLGRRE